MSATNIVAGASSAISPAANGSSTQTITPAHPPDAPTLRLQLHRSTPDKKVSWNTGTVDNENMGRKKSKCCCIYKKPRAFGESSSESEDDECDNCFGHVEVRKKKGHSHSHEEHPDNGTDPPNLNNDDDKTPPDEPPPAL